MTNPVSSPIALSSLQGMQKAETQFQTAAGNIAQLSAAPQGPPNPQAPDSLDLSSQMVALLGARDNFMANVGAAKTGDEMQRALLNIVA